MNKLINKLPITRIKIFLAGLLYRVVHVFCRRDRRIIVRNGIRYEVDLSEGIDLSMFLFGGFQKHITRNKGCALPEDAVVFDVGANCGMMTLQFAKLAPLGKVYSFEPTHYAFAKLQKNLELNPELGRRVVAVKSFVSSQTCVETDIKAYASWKVGGAADESRHSVHGGTAKSTEGVGAVSLDDFCEKEGIERLDFIKIDTDGHELEVLRGAAKVIGRFKPAVIFEVGLYILAERDVDFAEYLKFFAALNYSLFNSSNNRRIDAENYRRHIPSKGTIDILARYCAS
ncbi:MAG: FkbM family methyltransferase [Sedimentisphaerales bacterium]|nr:FkbM family methyltransferase [Sedimentisphaerales bacterium]